MRNQTDVFRLSFIGERFAFMGLPGCNVIQVIGYPAEY
jgi:hypothetical protein